MRRSPSSFRSPPPTSRQPRSRREKRASAVRRRRARRRRRSPASGRGRRPRSRRAPEVPAVTAISLRVRTVPHDDVPRSPARLDPGERKRLSGPARMQGRAAGLGGDRRCSRPYALPHQLTFPPRAAPSHATTARPSDVRKVTLVPVTPTRTIAAPRPSPGEPWRRHALTAGSRERSTSGTTRTTV